MKTIFSNMITEFIDGSGSFIGGVIGGTVGAIKGGLVSLGSIGFFGAITFDAMFEFILYAFLGGLIGFLGKWFGEWLKKCKNRHGKKS